MAKVTCDASDLLDYAERLEQAGRTVDARVGEVFTEWVAESAAVMRDEAPEDQGGLRDSIEITYHSPLSAEIIPTKRVEGAQGDHSLAHIIEYGAGNRPPNPFLARTRAAAMELAEAYTDELRGLL